MLRRFDYRKLEVVSLIGAQGTFKGNAQQQRRCFVHGHSRRNSKHHEGLGLTRDARVNPNPRSREPGLLCSHSHGDFIGTCLDMLEVKRSSLVSCSEQKLNTSLKGRCHQTTKNSGGWVFSLDAPFGLLASGHC